MHPAAEPAMTEADEGRNAQVIALFRDHMRLLRYLACRRFRVPSDDADNLVQDVFTVFIAEHDHIRQPHSWLIGAMSNASRHYWRERSRHEPLPADFDTWTNVGANESDTILKRLAVNATLQRLGDKCREALRRYYYADESLAEIANALATSRDYVKVLLHTCRKRARAMYVDLTRVKA